MIDAVSKLKFPLEDKVLASGRRHCFVRPGDCLGIAVSGGGDSIGLLLLYNALREKLGIRLAVVHFNHQLRGADSDADEAFVAEWSQRLGLCFFCERMDVAAKARHEHWNLEDAGRRLRYAFFERVVMKNGAARIATGHTLDDQAETVLARLCRGTGLRGLTAIRFARGCVVRPLLNIRRAEVRTYLRQRGVAWREDSSNQDCRRLRARIRHGLLPKMEAEYSPSIAIHLAELARQSQGEETLWGALVDDRFGQLVRRSQNQWEVDTWNILNGIPDAGGIKWPMAAQQALARRLIRRIAEGVCGNGNFPAARHVEQVMDLAATGSSGQRLDLPNGLQITREFDRLVFSRRPGKSVPGGVWEQPATYEYQIHLPAAGSINVNVPEIGACCCLKVFDWPMNARETSESLEALDPARLHSTLVLRNWHPGDAYWPIGGKRSLKVARLLMARRIPQRVRRGWPVLTSGGEIVWVRGLPLAQNMMAGSGTRTALVIRAVEI